VAQRQRQATVFDSIIGRDGTNTSHLQIPLNKAREMENVDLYRSTFARKRNGATDILDETTGEAWTGQLSFVGRQVAGADETAAVLWGIDNAATPKAQRLVSGGVAWSSALTFKDNISTRPQDVVAVNFNGKYYLAFDSSVDRLHVWDGSTIRRTGIAAPGAGPTVANTGAGAYAAVERHYLVTFVEKSGSVVLRSSDISASQSFTPSGAGTHARITQPTPPGEGETHWEIYISDDGLLFFYLTAVAIGTTTYDDNSVPSSHSANDPVPVAGEWTVIPSGRFLLVDDDRLLIAGNWEDAAYSSRVWWTPRQGSSSRGDDERIVDSVDQENWITLDNRDGGYITGMGGPIQGTPVVFKYRQIWKLRPTGSLTAPYQPLAISKTVGCIRHQSIVMAVDENGDPALYWLSYDGPYRMGVSGVQYLGMDVRDLWETVNLGATDVTCHAVYHADKHQVWFFVATGTSNTPDRILVFDTEKGEPDEDDNVRGGWTTFTGEIADARCSTMFSEPLSAVTTVLKPYTGHVGAVEIWRNDVSSTDNGTEYAASVTLPEQHLAGLTEKCAVDQCIVLGNGGPHTFLVNLWRDYGVEKRTANVTMEVETAAQTRTQKAFEAAFHADAKSIGSQIGDVCPTGLLWELDAFVIQWERRESISG